MVNYRYIANNTSQLKKSPPSEGDLGEALTISLFHK